MTEQPTTDDKILRAIENLDRTIGVPDSQITRVQHPAGEQLAGGIGILVEASGTDISQRIRSRLSPYHLAEYL
jgi:hypothetical protein